MDRKNGTTIGIAVGSAGGRSDEERHALDRNTTEEGRHSVETDLECNPTKHGEVPEPKAHLGAVVKVPRISWEFRPASDREL